MAHLVAEEDHDESRRISPPEQLRVDRERDEHRPAGKLNFSKLAGKQNR